MDVAADRGATRRPRFRRAAEPPAFRLTDADIEIVRQVAQYRMIRSTHIAALVGRSLDRTNDRLLRLFHAGYVDRPRAQLDYYPTTGSGPMVYALADRGARLLCKREGLACGVERSRKNREAGRPFIEHQVEVVNFEVALRRAVAQRNDLLLIPQGDMNVAACRRQMPTGGTPFALRAKFTHRGTVHEVGIVPDLVFGLQLANGQRRNFMVEIDRGTMPVRRADPRQTSFEGKMRVYLAAHAGKRHERQFGWKNFRVLTVTTDAQRLQTMQEAARDLRVPRSIGPSVFLFATFDDLATTTPLDHEWRDGNRRRVSLL